MKQIKYNQISEILFHTRVSLSVLDRILVEDKWPINDSIFVRETITSHHSFLSNVAKNVLVSLKDNTTDIRARYKKFQSASTLLTEEDSYQVCLQAIAGVGRSKNLFLARGKFRSKGEDIWSYEGKKSINHYIDVINFHDYLKNEMERYFREQFGFEYRR